MPGFFRTILLLLLAYLGYHFLKGLLSKGKGQIKGKSTKTRLDINESDIEDASFEDVKDDD